MTQISKGEGSIWDFAATRLVFEESGLPVSNIKGERLFLNSPETTFMNEQGVVYASDDRIREMILEASREIGLTEMLSKPERVA